MLGGLGTAILSTSTGVITAARPPSAASAAKCSLRVVSAMSRIGRKPIHVPAGVEIEVEPGRVTVKGPKGSLEQDCLARHVDRAATATRSS